MKSRIITMLVAFLVMLGNAVWGQETVSIRTAEELRAFAERANEDADNNIEWNVSLEADIDLGGESNPWTPIEQFRGTFDGKNHIIREVYINTPGTEGGYGFFIAVLGDVKNLNIEGNIVATGSTTYYGGICAGVGEDSYLSNCSFSGEINIEIDSYDQAPGIGGICGSFSTMISNCVNRADINVKINNLDMPWGPNPNVIRMFGIGGVAGQGASMIENCYNVGNLKIEGDDNAIPYLAIGGIAGIAGINNCYNIGSIDASIKNEEFIESNLRGSTSIGGLIGIFMLDIKNSYNIGKITALTETIAKDYYKGNIYGWNMFQEDNISNVYYLSQGIEAEDETILSATQDQFSSGEIAYELRKAGGNYGQDIHSDTPAESPTLLCFTPDDAVYKLTLDYSEVDTEKETEEKFVNSKYLGLPELTTEEEGKRIGWFDASDKEYTSESEIANDITLTAKLVEIVYYNVEVKVNDDAMGTATGNGTYEAGTQATVTATSNEGYEFVNWTNVEGNVVSSSSEYTFTVTADITLTANFQEKTESDEDQDNDKPGTIVKPIKYYNIYIDTICPGLNVEVSKDVVQEGHQVSAYLTIQAECDTTGMRFEYKRGLFGYWKDLKELEGVQPGEYIIKNIYTDIYIRALDATLPEEEPTGIEDLEGIKAYAKDGSIYVYTPNREEVTIISMSGAIIKHAEQIGLQSYNVSRGIYIVRIGEKVFKLKN